MNDAQKEREVIAAWLRGKLTADIDDWLKKAVKTRDLEAIANLIAADGLLPDLADAIERGDHLK